LNDAISASLVLPAICLAALGFAVPRVLAIWWPEGVKWLMGLAFVSALVMVACGVVFYVVLYAGMGISIADLYSTGGIAAVVHFVRLSLLSALLWLPLMVLSLAGVPKNWVREVW